MEDIIIRDASPADAPALSLLNQQEMGYDYPSEKTRQKLERLLMGGHDKILVAELAGRVVGYVHLNDYDLLYAGHMKNVMGIAVSSDCRRRGIGARLLSEAEDWARASGASGVRLVSGETRTGAHAFYRSLGYEGTKRQLNLKKSF